MSDLFVYGVVYRITCTVNGKQYHGQTVGVDQRWRDHFRPDSHCHALRNAINKYGRSCFVLDVLDTAATKDELHELEKKWVATSLAPHGYNIREGGAKGKPSKETRRKMSDASRKAQARPEVKAKNRAGVQAAWKRPGVREKWTASQKARWERDGERAKHSEKMKEVHARPGEKAKRSRAIRGSWAAYTEEERQERLEQHRNLYTPDRCAQMAQQLRKAWEDPAVREKHRNGVRKAMTPERRSYLSSRMQEIHAQPGEAKKRGVAISKALNTPKGKAKLQARRRRGESPEAWQTRTDQQHKA